MVCLALDDKLHRQVAVKILQPKDDVDSKAQVAELIREAPEHRLAGAARKAMLVRFAQAAATRLHGLVDPDSARPF